MTENVETVVVEEVAPTTVSKIKTALKQVDPKIYAAAAIAAIAGVGFAAYKRIENFEEREAARIVIIDETPEV